MSRIDENCCQRHSSSELLLVVSAIRCWVVASAADCVGRLGGVVARRVAGIRGVRARSALASGFGESTGDADYRVEPGC